MEGKGEKNTGSELQGALKGIWDSLTDEQKEKAKACKSVDELMKLAGEEGIELPDEMLDAVAGGYLYFNETFWTYEIVSDIDGEGITAEPDLEKAKKIARSYNMSTEIIDDNKRRELQNRSGWEKFWLNFAQGGKDAFC